MAPTSEPVPRAQQDHDPYRGQNSGDPYAAPNGNGRGYDNDWRADPYNDQGPSYYPPDEPTGGDAQSVHDRFFAPEADRAPPPPPPRYKDSQEDRDFHPAQRHSGVQGASSGFDDRREEDWDKFDQPPAPASVRPFHAPATIPDDDLDADFFADEDDYDADEYPPEKKGRKKLMAAVLVGAVVTGGGLAYVYKTSGGAGDGYPSIVSADPRPVKEDPAEPGGRDFPNGNKLIYDRLGGAAQEAGAAPTRLAGGSPSAKKEQPGVLAAGGTLEERIENALKAQKEEEPPAAQNRGGASASPDTPRTVRTMTFGPDGRPQAAEPKTQRIPANSIVATTQPTSATTSDDPSPAEELAETSAAAPPPQSASAPALRPTRTAAVAAPQISDSAGGSGNFFLQIAARNDQDAALAAFASLQQKYAGVLGNHAPSVRKVDLGEKGVWYRLLVGPIESKGEAEQLCEQLKTAGMKGCFARKD
jgi:cell division protein FtsN